MAAVPRSNNTQQHAKDTSEGEEGAGDDDVDPAELAAKMSLVNQWLAQSGSGASGTADPSVAAGAVTNAVTISKQQVALLEAAGPAAAEASVGGGAEGNELVAAGGGGLVHVERPQSSTGDDASSLADATSLVRSVLRRDIQQHWPACICSCGPDWQADLGANLILLPQQEQCSFMRSHIHLLPHDPVQAGMDGDDAGADLSRLKRYRKARLWGQEPRQKIMAWLLEVGMLQRILPSTQPVAPQAITSYYNALQGMVSFLALAGIEAAERASRAPCHQCADGSGKVCSAGLRPGARRPVRGAQAQGSAHLQLCLCDSGLLG